MPRFLRVDVGFYEQLCEEARTIMAGGGRPTMLQIHACRRLEEIRRLIERHPDAYDEEAKVLVVEEG